MACPVSVKRRESSLIHESFRCSLRISAFPKTFVFGVSKDHEANPQRYAWFLREQIIFDGKRRNQQNQAEVAAKFRFT